MPRRLLILNERDLANPLAGGAEVHLFNVFGRLAQRGYEVTLLAATFPGSSAKETIQGVQVRRLTNRYLFYALAPLVARREVRAGRYDLVVDILAKLPFLSPWIVPAPCLGVVHHLFGATAFRQVAWPIALLTWLSERLIPLAYRDTPMIAVSPSSKRDLIERGLRGALIRIVPNGVDHSLYNPGVPRAAAPSLVWLGRVEPYKRLDLLLRAMERVRAEVKDVKLLVVGAGTGLRAAVRLSERLGLEGCVEFSGYVAPTEKVKILRSAHAVVNTSEKEGWGLTVIEANACACT